MIIYFKYLRLNIGYKFNLYLYGPYCSDLTKEAYQLLDLSDFSKIDKVVPSEKKEKFEKFVRYIKNNSRIDDNNWLEISASYLYIKNNSSDLNDDDIIAMTQRKRSNFNIELKKIKEIIEDVKGEAMFNGWIWNIVWTK